MKITAKTLKGEVINIDIDPEATVLCPSFLDSRPQGDHQEIERTRCRITEDRV